MNDACKVLGAFIEIVPSELNLIIERGTDFNLDCILTDSQGTPINITNSTIKFTVRDAPGGTQKIYKENATGSHVDPTNGKTRFAFAKGDITDDQGSDRFYWVYEVRRVEGGDEGVYISGQFVVDPEVGGGS